MLLLFVGVFFGGMTLKVAADDYTVNAVVPAVLPTVPAVIVTPTTGTHFSTKPITVDGTCELNQIVKLYRNSVFSGMVICAADSTFQLQTDLFDGSNILQARIFNITNGEGPTSPTVTVYYDPPVSPPADGGNSGTGSDTPSSSSSGSSDGSGSSSSSGGQVTGAGPFILNSDGMLRGYYTGDTVEIDIDAEGGTPPYAISVSWGDGKTSIISRKQAGIFKIKHVYTKAGGYKDTYSIKISSSDSADNSTYLQFSIIVHDKNNIPYGAAGVASTTELPPLNFPFQLKVLWPVYGVTTLMAASFWLGQRRELQRLRLRLKLHR
jgi:hypothetical protein